MDIVDVGYRPIINRHQDVTRGDPCPSRRPIWQDILNEHTLA